MSDVARVARVGKMTVSRVLNGSPHVSKTTYKRVFAAIQKLNYRPNEAARALRAQRSRCIGLIVPSLLDPFFATCAHAVQGVAQRKGYMTMTVVSDYDRDVEKRLAEVMLHRQIDGIIVVPADSRNSVLAGNEFAHVPIVTLDSPFLDTEIRAVVVENQTGARTAVEHLISHGHKRIAFLGPTGNLFTIRKRLAGFRQAVKSAGVESCEVLKCDTYQHTVDAVRDLFTGPNQPSAIFTPNNMTTKMTMEALRELKIDVPSKVALVGFDDFELADILNPTLTVVRQPAERLGERAAELLFEKLENPEEERTEQQVVLPVELVVRCSCGCQ